MRKLPLSGVFVFALLFMLLPVCPHRGNAQSRKTEAISCFVYHRFGDSRYPSTNVPVNDFRAHLQFLADNGFRVITLGGAVELLRQSKQIAPGTVVLTVDDAYSSFYEKGMPLLREFGFTATVFVNTQTAGHPGYITWPQLRQLKREGIEIGSHSHSHAHFINFNEPELGERFQADLEKSQQIFRENLGAVPRLFSYPYGEHNAVMGNMLRENGFLAAAAQNSGVISEFSNLWALPRFPMAGRYAGIDNFRAKAAMKALALKPVAGTGHLLGSANPPQLQAYLLAPEEVSTENIQCFVAGRRECSWTYDREKKLLTMTALQPLRSRRTLYTLTAPSAREAGAWHWYSHLWIDAGQAE